MRRTFAILACLSATSGCGAPSFIAGWQASDASSPVLGLTAHAGGRATGVFLESPSGPFKQLAGTWSHEDNRAWFDYGTFGVICAELESDDVLRFSEPAPIANVTDCFERPPPFGFRAVAIRPVPL